MKAQDLQKNIEAQMVKWAVGDNFQWFLSSKNVVFKFWQSIYKYTFYPTDLSDDNGEFFYATGRRDSQKIRSPWLKKAKFFFSLQLLKKLHFWHLRARASLIPANLLRRYPFPCFMSWKNSIIIIRSNEPPADGCHSFPYLCMPFKVDCLRMVAIC